MQKLLNCITHESTVRSTIQGWTFEDSDEVNEASAARYYQEPNTIPVGFIRSGLERYPCYPTVLHAMGDGWKLLAPPTESKVDDLPIFDWWLVRD